MPFTTPPTAVTGSVVQAQHRNVLKSNDLWFNALVPAPGAADQVPALTSSTAGAWAKLGAVSFQGGAVTTAKINNGAVTTAKVADASLDAAELASAAAGYLTPPGLIVMVRTAAEIPVNWDRESQLDGRMPVHDGTTFSVTYVEGTNYGSSWSHLHPTSITTSGPDATVPNLDAESGGGTYASTNHTHPATEDTDPTAWVIPSRAYVFMRFDP